MMYTTMDDIISLTTKEEISFFRMAQLKARLKLELHGMKCHGPSAYSLIKSSYGLKGSRGKVLTQLEALMKDVSDRKPWLPECHV